MEQKKEYLKGKVEDWSFLEIYSPFTLSLKKQHAPTRDSAERLIRELIQDSLELDDRSSGSVRVIINTDSSCYIRSSGYHVGFLKPLSAEQENQLARGMERERRRRRLGSGDRFFVPNIENASWYLWRQSGSPSVVKIRLRKKNKFLD